MRRTQIGLGILLLSLIGVCDATAQTEVTSVSGIEFTPSADHTATNGDGSPVVVRYESRFIPSTGCPAVAPVNLTKPTPVSNLITIRPLAAFATLPQNCTYTMTLVAMGSGGEGVSVPSAPFRRTVIAPPRAPAAPGQPIVRP